MTAEPDPAELLRSLRARPEQLTEQRTLLLGDETDVRASLVTLADAQRRTEERIQELADAQRRTEERVQELADAQRRTEERVQELADAQRRLTDQITRLAARVTDLEGQVATLTGQVATLTEQMAALTSQVAALTSQVAALTSQVGNLAGDVAWLRGDAWERRHRERGHVYFREIARRLRPLDARATDDLLDPAVDEGRLSYEGAEQVRLADALFRGRRRADGAELHLVVEVSLGVGLDDVRRARERADLLSGADIPSVAVVAGQWVNSDAARAARALGVWQVTDGRTVPPDDGQEPVTRTA